MRLTIRNAQHPAGQQPAFVLTSHIASNGDEQIALLIHRGTQDQCVIAATLRLTADEARDLAARLLACAESM